MKRKRDKKIWPSPTGIWIPDFWTNLRPRFKFWGRLDQSSLRKLKFLDFIKSDFIGFFKHTYHELKLEPTLYMSYPFRQKISSPGMHLMALACWTNIFATGMSCTFVRLTLGRQKRLTHKFLHVNIFRNRSYLRLQKGFSPLGFLTIY